MTEPNFAVPERRSFALPLLAAIVALALAVAFAIHLFPATTVNIAHVKTEVMPTRTVFHNDTLLVKDFQNVDELFIAETIEIDNQLRTQLFLDGFTLTVSTEQGDVVEHAIAQKDFADLKTNFPSLEKVLGEPALLPEMKIDAGKRMRGVVLFGTRLSKEQWEARKSAVVKVDLYHQVPVYQTIPK